MVDISEQPKVALEEKPSGGHRRRGGPQGQGDRDPDFKRPGRDSGKGADSEAVEQVISINRITKVTKGGKKLSFSALVVVGNAKGKVGYSLEKAAEVSIAIRKAIATAKKNMMIVSLNGLTIPHEIIGHCGGATVLLKPAAEGTGVIAAGPVRAVCDGVGIRNILTKCHRSNNPINVVKATMDGLSRLKAADTVKKE
ncbi:MAG: 30S ribosomal protein S5 [Candidatus Omnitrophica bacterium]|nr:30S ribosomal protein S5 [Candidatus Omnitrophota bacterium]